MRRIIDILAAAAALAVLSPVLIMIALAVMFDSPGGPFYFSPRVGRNGKVFLMWKFRTMAAGAAALGSITGRNDPRITRLGNLLRRTKLDELPQFVNVLLGHMTLVGPRPESPDIVARYTPAQRAVLAVKPGITGRVQLDSKEESEAIPEGVKPEEYYVENLLEPKLLADLEYLRTRTPLTDARIILETAGFVLRNSLFTTRNR
jgi:lipopolysaccharide/colanic/teichoic acid biosynthesis glycosyltransferase